MLKRKAKNKNSSKGQLFIVGSLLIILGAGMIGGKLLNSYLDKQKEKDLINDFYVEQESIVDVPIIDEEQVEEVV